ncbi:MAG: cytochrome C [Anaeromyxobacteraceae bacterium]|nr:cytochrome C [Anaeromyxobacteraceae bacterium]
MITSLLLASLLHASPAAPAAAAAPKESVVIPTRQGKLEFSHKEHAKAACAACHAGQATPGRFGLKGSDAAHKYCVNCHKAEKKGPQACGACHKKPGGG